MNTMSEYKPVIFTGTVVASRMAWVAVGAVAFMLAVWLEGAATAHSEFVSNQVFASLVGSLSGSWILWLVFPIFEEVLKSSMAMWASSKRPLLCAAWVGLVFGLAECCVYFFTLAGTGWGLSDPTMYLFLRAFAVGMHVLSTVLVVWAFKNKPVALPVGFMLHISWNVMAIYLSPTYV